MPIEVSKTLTKANLSEEHETNQKPEHDRTRRLFLDIEDYSISHIKDYSYMFQEEEE